MKFADSSIPSELLAVLRLICDRLTHVDARWALTGSLGMALQGVRLEIHDIDLQTDADGARRIEASLREFVVSPVRFAVGSSIRSWYGTFRIASTTVELMGDVEKLLSGGTWERPPDLKSIIRVVQVADLHVPVLDLDYEEQAYRKLGRVERADLLRRWLRDRDKC
jgi:hypothetical protein